MCPSRAGWMSMGCTASRAGPLTPRRRGIRRPAACNASQQLSRSVPWFARISLSEAGVHLEPIRTNPWIAASTSSTPPGSEPRALTAAERVIASELEARGQACDALSMMVSSVARMVQASRCSENRWNAG